jgi:hypothetical protein
VGTKGDKCLKVTNLSEVGLYYEDYLFTNYSLWLEFVRTIINYPAQIMLPAIFSAMLKYLRYEPEMWTQFALRIVSFSRIKSIWTPRISNQFGRSTVAMHELAVILCTGTLATLESAR